MEWALWFKNAAMETIVAIPSTTAIASERFGMTASPPDSPNDRTDRSTTRQ